MQHLTPRPYSAHRQPGLLRTFRFENLQPFLDSLEPGPGDPDQDGLARRYRACGHWPCSGRYFHSKEEARQYFLSECLMGSGLWDQMNPGMQDPDVFALADRLFEAGQALESPIQRSAIVGAAFQFRDQLRARAARACRRSGSQLLA